MHPFRLSGRAGRAHAFTLVELLVVIGIIALLISIFLPALSRARASANRAKCLANMRSMQISQALYATENHGYLIQAGMSHGGAHAHEEVAWFNVLERYGSNKLLPRCPSDDSIHWPGGTPVSSAGGVDVFRRTSYGINDFLDRDMNGSRYVKMNQVRRTSVTVQFLEMAYLGEFAAADHPHIENWDVSLFGGNVPLTAAGNVQIQAHGNRRSPRVARPEWDSVANYGFLDGHAESLSFRDVYTDSKRNKFDPAIAQ